MDDKGSKPDNKGPVKGSDQIGKNLSTLPEGDISEVELIDQVAPENNPSESQPAQDSGGNDTR